MNRREMLCGLVASAAMLVSSQAVAAQSVDAPYFVPTEKSLVRYNVPEWYEDAKIGYWVHWGLYSVPSYAGDHAAEWYGRWMYAVDDKSGNKKGKGYDQRGLKTAQHHRETYGDPKEFGYKDFIPMWKAEKFDAEQWADLFTEGGAKFFTMMAMHHDNYPLWNSESVPINSATTGPKRDFVAEMEKAIRKRGLKFGVSNHSAWNSRFFEFNHVNGFDAKESTIYGNAEVGTKDVTQWWGRSTELVEKYHPDLVWFDWCWNLLPYNKINRMNFVSWYYNRAADWGMASAASPEVVVAYKSRTALPAGSAVLDVERGGMTAIEKNVWMNDTSLGLKSWSYAPDEEYRTADQTVDMLLDIISKNGILLLNIGPKADGSIPELAQESIRSIGAWLSKNGEGVYATRPWCLYGEGPTHPTKGMHGDQVEYTNEDIRFTRSKDNKTLYIHVLGYNKEVNVTSLKSGAINLGSAKLVMLSSGKEVKYTQNESGLRFKMPKDADSNDAAFSFKMSFSTDVPTL